jgi:CubicO group peptidase (beta-lactamase class C family)
MMRASSMWRRAAYRAPNRVATIAFVLLCLLAFSPQAVKSAPQAEPQALNTAFTAWLSQHGVANASMAIMKGNAVVASFNYGAGNAKTPARVASLSKAITGVCIATLIDQGRLSFKDNLGSVFAKSFATAGEPVDPRFKTITIEQLLMHRSGLPRDAKGDQFGDPAAGMDGLFAAVLKTPLQSDPGGDMLYSNIGYLTLGKVVEAITGNDYESFCRHAVLEAAGVTGSIDPGLRHRAPNGGWVLSAEDYAKFLQVFSPGSKVLGKTSRAWLEARSGDPAYGLGTFLRHTAMGLTLSHDGKVPARIGGGAYQVKLAAGWTAVVIFDGTVDDAAYGELEHILFAGLRGQL